jgi:Rps23 Pro-64 3,4-dihydroxylase Tpa1-like proline 4-hydroxylase
MKLIYSIPNKLYYIQNFLDYPTYKKLHYDVFKSSLIKLESTEKIWQSEITRGYKNFVKRTKDLMEILDIKYPPLKKIKILLETNPFYKVKINTFKPIAHSMENNSGINWHDDTGHKYGITYYINRRWNHKFGGEFLFKDKKSNGFIPFVGNSLVIIKTPLLHKVTPVMKSLVPRKTIQIFVDND